MNSIIDQQRDNKDFMYCIDPLGYYYLSEEDPDDTLVYLLQKGLITLSELIRIRHLKK
jgi:hypothetical protein